ncbi:MULTISPECIES: TRAP transporter substrate-binding protein [Aurantimonas]|jgi:TRAP-type transport system periplasmic protein|uniref:TRAP transporter substrate-binding protein n=1 Tax=Aurantimonas TaxID=182269 RepID=UPI00040840E7|nr:TRAP transporter substrate-binding protein [Aurantimonas coralicida]MAP17835.1 C4-dicarboxylate ABC transporter [Aurantimonas sp.]MCC4298029.1 TRAP transporter substrate-binding protein [Aurantimonas coralicida]MCW7542773.1 TRAP transporter substrate-binding protein [Aurantimonas litoralis]
MNIRTLMLGVAAVALMGSAAGAQESLDLGHVGDPGSLYEATAEKFAECVAASGKATVEVYGSSQLGNDEEMLQKLKLGQIDFSIPSSVMSSVSPTFGVFEMPYLIKSRDHMKKVRDGMRDTFVDAAAGRGYQILGFWENGFRNVTNNVKPINVPADLEGIKLRVPKGEWRVKMFQSYGANPTPMAFSEVFTALQTGVIDGQENPLAQIYSGRFQEVQKYLSMTGHVYSPAYLATSSRNWDGWDEELKTAIQDCATQASDFAYERSQQMDDELISKIEEAGVTVNEADKDAFIAASKAIYEEFGTQVEGGQKLVEDIQALASGS